MATLSSRIASALLLAWSSSLALANVGPDKRLIQFSETGRAWMTESEIVALSLRSHQAGHCGGFMDITEHPVKKPLFLRPIDLFVSDPIPSQRELVERLLPELSSKRIEDTVRTLSSFQNRYYQSEHGVAAVHWIRDQFAAMSKSRTDVEIRLIQHSFKQPSLIATIRGSKRPDEHVIIGAHADSVNWSSYFPGPNDRAPGADDDASGIATMLETFRVVMESGFRPDRTLEFMAYAGEERGLLGSQDIAESYKRARTKVAGVLQLDMTLYPGRGIPAINLVNDKVDRGLTRFLAILIDTYVKVAWKETSCGYACSDHASWTTAGFPAAFPFEAPSGDYNPNIHTVKDVFENNLDAEFGLHFAKLALAFTLELGSVD